MGYRGCMGYGMHFPANQLGGLKKVWGFREYGLSRLWIMRESTVAGSGILMGAKSATRERMELKPTSPKMSIGTTIISMKQNES